MPSVLFLVQTVGFYWSYTFNLAARSYAHLLENSTDNLPISGMPYLQYLGLGGGIDMSWWTSLHNWGTILCTIPLHISPHISLLCTVCDREIWVSAEFTKNFWRHFQHNEREDILCNVGQFWLTTNPSGKISTPPFSNICPRYARWGIPLIGG